MDEALIELAKSPMVWLHVTIVILVVAFGVRSNSKLKRIVIEFNGSSKKDNAE
ncbi:MAG: hypothetical protein ACRDQZ_25520 [Mycobacteriales bacterium]